MSMHDIEDAVADAIAVLDAHDPPTGRCLRDHFAVLYRFQDGFDCSFTHFRVMDVLLRHRYTYRFPIDRHPDYVRRRGFFDALDEFTALREYDDDAEFFGDWLEDGYVDPPHLYCDAGTDLWRRMVEAGHLTGPDALPPRPTPLIEVVRAVAAAAERDGDHDLIATWYHFGPHMLDLGHMEPPEDAECVDPSPPGVNGAPNATVRDLREIVRRTDALSIRPAYDHRPPPEAMDELESWWWTIPPHGAHQAAH